MIGDPSVSAYPAWQEVRAHSGRQAHLVAGDDRRGGIEQQWGLLSGGRGEGEGVGAHLWLGAKGRGCHDTGCGGADADHAFVRRQHRMVPYGTCVAGVVQGDESGADLFRLLDGDAHVGGAVDDGQRTFGIDNRRALGLLDDAPFALRIELPGPVALDI